MGHNQPTGTLLGDFTGVQYFLLVSYLRICMCLICMYNYIATCVSDSKAKTLTSKASTFLLSNQTVGLLVNSPCCLVANVALQSWCALEGVHLRLQTALSSGRLGMLKSHQSQGQFFKRPGPISAKANIVERSPSKYLVAKKHDCGDFWDLGSSENRCLVKVIPRSSLRPWARKDSRTQKR